MTTQIFQNPDQSLLCSDQDLAHEKMLLSFHVDSQVALVKKQIDFVMSQGPGFLDGRQTNYESLFESADKQARIELLMNQDAQALRRWMYLSVRLFEIGTEAELGGLHNLDFSRDRINLSQPLFNLILCDHKGIQRRCTAVTERIADARATPFDWIGINWHMTYNTLLMLEGRRFELLESRALHFLDNLPVGAKRYKPDYEFMLGLARADTKLMRQSLSTFLKPRKAKAAAKDTVYEYNFVLQPQLLCYLKLASRLGFNLEIETDMAPTVLSHYQPLEPADYLQIETDTIAKHLKNQARLS